MLNISGFLEKFKRFDQNKKLQTENIIQIVERVVGIRLENKNFVVKDGVLRIHGSPVLRQEIFLKKEHLLPFLKAEGVLDVR